MSDAPSPDVLVGARLADLIEVASELDLATLGNGLGNWYLYDGDLERAEEVLRCVTFGPYWPTSGFIPVEVDAARRTGLELDGG